MANDAISGLDSDREKERIESERQEEELRLQNEESWPEDITTVPSSEIEEEATKIKDVLDTAVSIIEQNVSRLPPSIMEQVTPVSSTFFKGWLMTWGTVFYSLVIDEWMDGSQKKMLAICIQYYSASRQSIRATFLKMLNLGASGTSDTIGMAARKNSGTGWSRFGKSDRNWCGWMQHDSWSKSHITRAKSHVSPLISKP
eukprot:gene10431-11524_t